MYEIDIIRDTLLFFGIIGIVLYAFPRTRSTGPLFLFIVMVVLGCIFLDEKSQIFETVASHLFRRH